MQNSNEAAINIPDDHALIGQSERLPASAPSQVVSISPVVLPVPGRITPLQMRISAPATGHDLPIILLSHGHGHSNNLSSLNGYGPLANFWAAHGFAVIQPTHLSSKSLSLDLKTPGAPIFWRSRVEDMTCIIDQLSNIEDSIPHLERRLDRSRIAIAGHSAGGHTASLLLGAQLIDPDDGKVVSLIDQRIKAGILLGAPGDGAGLSAMASERFPYLRHTDFSTMKTQTLVVCGDNDANPNLSTRGADWAADPYHLGPGPKSLLTLVGGTHCLGGVSGYDAAECTDESPERAAAVQRLSWAYLRSELYDGDKAWETACAALKGLEGIGRVESK